MMETFIVYTVLIQIIQKRNLKNMKMYVLFLSRNA